MLRNLFVASLLFLPGMLLANDQTVVPGLMGPNALPTLRLDDAVIGDDVLIEIAGTGQMSNDGRDRSATPYFRIMVPFRQLAALEFDGQPLELWQTSADRQNAIGAPHNHGLAPGDIRFGARFYLIRESWNVPAFAVRFITKTTTGKAFDDHRFTNAPAYYLDGLFAKTILENEGFLRRLRLMAQIGFMAWQQGTNGQNDAVTFGAGLEAILKNKLLIDLQVRGYSGWEKYDKPVTSSLTVSYPFQYLRVFLNLDRGLTRDAPAWEGRVGVEFYFELPYLKRRRPPGEPPARDPVRH